MFSGRIMLPPNEMLEIPLWGSASCRSMRKVFMLQNQFRPTVFDQEEGNTRREGHISLLLPVIYRPAHTQRTPRPLNRQLPISWSRLEYQNPPLPRYSYFYQNTPIPVTWNMSISHCFSLPPPPFICFLHIFLLRRTMAFIEHTYPELGHKSILVI